MSHMTKPFPLPSGKHSCSSHRATACCCAANPATDTASSGVHIRPLRYWGTGIAALALWLAAYAGVLPFPLAGA